MNQFYHLSTSFFRQLIHKKTNQVDRYNFLNI